MIIPNSMLAVLWNGNLVISIKIQDFKQIFGETSKLHAWDQIYKPDTFLSVGTMK